MTSKIKQLMAITGKNAKKIFLLENQDDETFLRFLQLRLNPYYTYGIKKIERIPANLDNTLTFQEFEAHLMYLSKVNVTNQIREITAKLLSRAFPEDQEILAQIITKELALGVDTSVNKALGYKLIPTFNVMLAATHDNFTYPVWAEEKLDGVRCVILVREGKSEMYTRNGRRLHFRRIQAQAERLAGLYHLTNYMFDCELTTELRTSVSGICNKNMKSGYTADQDELMMCNMFDVLPLHIYEQEGRSDPQMQRTKTLELLFKAHIFTHLSLVEGQYIYSAEKLKQVANQYILNGKEGVIVKDPHAIYYYRRNKAWAKIKSINSCSLLVVDTTKGKGARKNQLGALICETSDKQLRVNVGSGLTQELIEIFTNVSPIGKIIEVHFNVLIKGKGSNVYSLFLPRYVNTRIDLEEADSLQKIQDQHIGRIEIA